MEDRLASKCDHPKRSWVGYRVASGTRPAPRPDCDRPVWFRCDDCGALTTARCNVKDIRGCEPCAERYRRQVRWRAGDGIAKPGQTLALTITAPGASTLPWDTGKCNHVASIECSGKMGCRVDKALAAAWNGEASPNFNHLLQDLHREYGAFEYFRAVEVQERGLLHYHLVIKVKSAAVWNQSVCRRLATKHAFGSQVKLDMRPALEKLGGYLAKYVSKSVSERRSAPMPEGKTWRVYSASRNWGMTMAQIRHAQFLFAVRLHDASAAGVGLVRETDSGGEAPALITRLGVTQATLATAVAEAM